MYRQDKELQNRWDDQSIAFVVDSLLHGKPTSPHGTHEGRVDLRGIVINQPERVRVNENFDRISKVYELTNAKISDVDLGHCILPEWRIMETEFTNCKFSNSIFASLRTYSAKFADCLFRGSVMRGASLGAKAADRKSGGQYYNCDFTGADLRQISTEYGRFSSCTFVETKWQKTQTLSAVFEYCDFRNAEIDEVFFDGRRFDKRGLAGLGENRLKGCDFSTARLEGTSFLAIDFRDLIPPKADRYVLVENYPLRVQVALNRLQSSGSREAQGLAFVFEMEFKAASVLPKDATGMLDFGGLSETDAQLLTAVFELDR
jgi:uncharacterized protein YjbI with pentapeptide repeats